MDTCTNRWERGNRRSISSYNHLVDSQKKEQKQSGSRNDSVRVGRKYSPTRRKIIFGVFTIILTYSLLNIIIDTTGDEDDKQFATFGLTKLRPIDYEQYTIRINTWRRPKQLVQSVKHHASCSGVKEIQIVWCDKENEPPQELLMLKDSLSDTRVVIEHHEFNSLNERFNILEPTPTLGILSIDDDVLRPCDAIDAGFFKWVKSPHRMVGFDARTHVENDDGSWQYGYLSTTKKENMYSMSLTRYCFVHRDYMNRYQTLPKEILDTVSTKFNCEDIAMSLMISSLTNGHPPLLADLWAMNSQVKLEVDAGISSSGTHKKFRDNCLDSFAKIFGLKDRQSADRLQRAQWVHHEKSNMFDCGAEEDASRNLTYKKSKREEELEKKWKKLRHSSDRKNLKKYLLTLLYEAGEDARANGLLYKNRI